jgi:hypothetical protein
MWRVARETTRQTRWLVLGQTESLGRDGYRIARLERGWRSLAGTILTRMFGRPDGRSGRLGGQIIAHMNARLPHEVTMVPKRKFSLADRLAEPEADRRISWHSRPAARLTSPSARNQL